MKNWGISLSINNNKVNGLLGLAARSGNIIYGTDAVIEAIYKKKVKLVIIAEDSSEKTKEKLIAVCLKNNIKNIFYGTIFENSKVIVKTNKAILAIKYGNFAEAILERIYGGDTIG